jgi:ketosteroid isomerase-like protein
VPDLVEREKAIVAAFQKGSIQALFDSAHRNITWEVPGPANHPALGVHVGRDAFVKAFQEMLPLFEFEKFELIDILASENRTALLIHERFKVVATGKTLEQDTVITHRWEDGKIVEYHEFIDTQGMAEIMKGAAT